MGATRVEGAAFCRLSDGRAEGCAAGNVFGTYLHGLFDTGEATARLADALCRQKGLDPAGTAPLSHEAFQQQEFDKLAARRARRAGYGCGLPHDGGLNRSPSSRQGLR